MTLPIQPKRLLLAMSARFGGLVSRAELVDALFGDREDGGPLDALDVYMSMARTAATSLGLVIDVSNGRGYTIRPYIVTQTASSPVAAE